MYRWFSDLSAIERRTFWACFLGWALDAFDVQLFSLVIPTLLGIWHISKADAGIITGVSLVTAALGGWFGGAVSDRLGRVATLQIMILWFAVSTFVSAFVQDYQQLLLLKALQGFGFGGEWAVGVALMSEVVIPANRGKALGSVQSAWAIGWGAAVLLQGVTYALVPAEFGWRVLFGFGLLPALLVIYVRRYVPEPVSHARMVDRSVGSVRTSLFGIFAPDMRRGTLVGLLLGTGAHGGYYAVTSWLPTYLQTERGLSVLSSGAYLAVIILAFFCGCLAAANLLDRIGRRRTVGLFAASCVVVVLAYVFIPVNNVVMLFLGFPLGFCAAGIPASMGALFAELYPGGMRGTGVGFCYNAGRILSAVFPPLVGYFSQGIGLGAAIGFDAAFAYALVVVAVFLLPETKGVVLRTTGPVPVSGL